MKATIDGTIEFEQLGLQVESFSRDTVERAVAGLDGKVSIDLGRRGRQLQQRGILRAASSETLRSSVESFSGLVDGNVHSLVLEDGRRYDDLRIDAFKVEAETHGGAGSSCSFEVRYTQLKQSQEEI
jgi:hypothetical protein